MIKDAPLKVIAHETVDVGAISTQPPAAIDAYNAGARTVRVEYADSLGGEAWLTLDELDAEVGRGIMLGEVGELTLTLVDIRALRLISDTSCRVGLTYLR